MKLIAGNIVQNKCTSVSYKVKKKRPKNEAEYIRVENTHEAIVSKELFMKVQEIIKNKKTMSSPKHDFLFKGLMFCHNCGRKSRVCYRGKSEKIGYIDCSLARGKDKKCRTANYNYNKFEEKTLNAIRDICGVYCDKNALKEIYEKCKNNYNDMIVKERECLNNLLDRLDKVSKKLEKLYRDNLNEIITDEEYHKYSREFIEEREALKRQKKIIQDKINTITEKQKSSKNDDEMDKTIKEFLKLEKPSKKILYELINRVELDEYKNIYIYFNFSELDIINESLNEKYIIRSAY